MACSRGYLSLSPVRAIFRSIGWNEDEKKKGGGREKKRTDGWICIGGAGLETSIRLDSISRPDRPHSHHPHCPLNGNRIGDSRFVSRFCMTVDPGPVQRRNGTRRAPIVRIDDVKSLEPRQFRADFTHSRIIVHSLHIRISRVWLRGVRLIQGSISKPVSLFSSFT